MFSFHPAARNVPKQTWKSICFGRSAKANSFLYQLFRVFRSKPEQMTRSEHSDPLGTIGTTPCYAPLSLSFLPPQRQGAIKLIWAVDSSSYFQNLTRNRAFRWTVSRFPRWHFQTCCPAQYLIESRRWYFDVDVFG